MVGGWQHGLCGYAICRAECVRIAYLPRDHQVKARAVVIILRRRSSETQGALPSSTPRLHHGLTGPDRAPREHGGDACGYFVLAFY